MRRHPRRNWRWHRWLPLPLLLLLFAWKVLLGEHLLLLVLLCMLLLRWQRRWRPLRLPSLPLLACRLLQCLCSSRLRHFLFSPGGLCKLPIRRGGCALLLPHRSRRAGSYGGSGSGSSSPLGPTGRRLAIGALPLQRRVPGKGRGAAL